MMTIYFDMDGVLADFDRGLRELCHFTPLPVNEPRTQAFEEAMWTEIRAVPHFYGQLQPMPGAIEMFRQIHNTGVPCEILTGIPKPRRKITAAGEDKVDWVRRYLSEDTVTHIVMKEDKPLYCKGRDSILIDDTESNISAWEAIGGIGILHTEPAETLARLREILPAL